MVMPHLEQAMEKIHPFPCVWGLRTGQTFRRAFGPHSECKLNHLYGRGDGESGVHFPVLRGKLTFKRGGKAWRVERGTTWPPTHSHCSTMARSGDGDRRVEGN